MRAGHLGPMRPVHLLPIVLFACNALTFTVEQRSTTTIEGAGLLGEVLGAIDFTGLDDFDLEIERKMADQGVDDGDLRHVELTRLALTASPDLSFIESMDIYVTGEGVAPILVATQDSFPTGQETVELDLTGEDLTGVVVAGAMRFEVDVTGSAPVDDTDVRVDVEVTVEATPQGACKAAQG